MKEAGYMFDFEKKELKKIENKIEIPFGAKDSELQEATYYIPKGFHAEIDNDKVVIKKGGKPTAWSEEDKSILEDIKAAVASYWDEMTEDTILDWLKSFKDRVQPQPKQEWSEEDKHRVKDTIYFLDTAKKHYASTVELDACINWLKSLKQRIGG
jgi:hypothetical protein